MPPTLTDSATALGGPHWLVERRAAHAARFAELGVPKASEEVWRYSPIDTLDFESRSPALPGPGASLPELEQGASCVLRLSAGRLLAQEGAPTGVSVLEISAHPEGAELLDARTDADDALCALNGSTLVDGLVLDVARGTQLAAPIVVLHDVPAGTSVPRLVVRVADGAAVSVVEVFLGGGEDTLNIPVTELTVGDGANLTYGAIQLLATGSWHLATVKAAVGRDGTVSQLAAGLGASYDRLRTDVLLSGQGASSILRATYLGNGEQVHDLRTLQDHAAPRTVSDLLCKGAVDDASRSVYTGVIKVRHGAVRTDAHQTNHNLVLSPHAHADSVPNLDIAENDVRCSHASTVGPLDEDQRYYLESRGIEPAVADQLLIAGFFRDLLDRTPLSAAAAVVRAKIEARLGDKV